MLTKADATSPSDGRARTNVTLKTRSEGFAKRLLDAALTDAQRVERAYLMALTRTPVKAWQSLCHVQLATNEFIHLQ